MENKVRNNFGNDGEVDFENHIVLVNTNIHLKAKLTRVEFLEKIKHVKYLRTGINTNFISFYITSITDYKNLIRFHNLINKGIFDFEESLTCKVFAVALKPKLYNWFKKNPINLIEKQIVAWLASNYFFCENKREILQEQIYKPLFLEMLEVIKTHYNDFDIVNFENNSIYKKKCREKYLNVCIEFYGSEPPEFLDSPFEYKIIDEWGTNDKVTFDFIIGYFRDDDWKHIIERNNEDDLSRVESKDNLWLKWKHVFSIFEERNNFVYSFYSNDLENTKKIKHKREKISDDVKNQVWNRDGGVCVQCNNNEKLEFDHIIPIVKGGSSTYRNVQLLCESCNRKKHSKI